MDDSNASVLSGRTVYMFKTGSLCVGVKQLRPKWITLSAPMCSAATSSTLKKYAKIKDQPKNKKCDNHVPQRWVEMVVY